MPTATARKTAAAATASKKAAAKKAAPAKTAAAPAKKGKKCTHWSDCGVGAKCVKTKCVKAA